MPCCRQLLPFFLPLLAAAQNASLQGVVLNTQDHQPIAKVHVRLRPFHGSDETVYGAMSDRDGRFSIANLPPGAYYAIPECAGFAPTLRAKRASYYAGVTLKAGETRTDFTVEMTPRAVIRGRVVDEYGDPPQYARVQIEAASKEDPPFSATGGAFAQTDDRGEFRTSGLPGKYYIQASNIRGPRPAGKTEIRTDGSSDPVYATTYFPSSPSKEGATLIEVKPGDVTPMVEIRAVRQQQNLSISGVVTGAPAGATLPMVTVEYTVSSGESSFSTSSALFTDPGGQFTFTRARPGSYRLSARYSSGQTVLQSPVHSALVSNADVTGIVLPLTEPGEIVGAVQVAGDKTILQGTVQLTGLDGTAFTATSVPIEKDGAFHVRRAAVGRYRIAIEPLPENAFIQAVLLDGVPVRNNEFEIPIGARSSALKIIVNRNGGQISGTVAGKDGVVLTGGTSTVYLTQQPGDRQNRRSVHVKDDGTYLMQGIAPGKYHLFATDIFTSVGIRNQDFFAQLAASAEEIEVKEGDRLTKKLTPVSTEDGNAQPTR